MTDSNPMKTAIPAVLIPVVAVLLYAFLPGVREMPWSGARIAGALAAVTGYVLLCFARIQLGMAFAVRPKATELVTHGLYSRIRNPIYVFADLMLFGLILVFDFLWLLVVLAGMIIAQRFQARREAAVLKETFGHAYVEYRRQTWF